MLQAGIYKDNDTDIPDYVGCTDEAYESDKSVVTDEVITQSIDSYAPEVLKSSAFNSYVELLKVEASKLSGDANSITESYNLDKLDEAGIYRLISFYNIEYPFDYKVEWLELIVKNIEKIRRVRGTEKSIRMLLRILERSESDLYGDDSDDIEISGSDGVYTIHSSRIQNVEFAKYMIRKVLRAGIQFTFDNEYRRNEYSISCTTLIQSSGSVSGSGILDVLQNKLDKSFTLDAGSPAFYEFYEY